MDENRTNLTPVVSAILKVLVAPFWELLERLMVEGRISEEELNSLRATLRDRSEQLPDLLREELRKEPGNWTPT